MLLTTGCAGRGVAGSGLHGSDSNMERQGRAGGAAAGPARERKARGRRALTTAQRVDRVADRAVINEYMEELMKVRRILQKVRLEHALLEAYQADGWCSASREKVKPVAEIARARAKLVQYKADLKECIKAMDESGGDRSIDLAHYDSDGELGEEHIFCGKCGIYESWDENDIILCDGNCHRAYHQLCVRPPIDLDAIGEGEPWLCPACDAKASDVGNCTPVPSLPATGALGESEGRGRFDSDREPSSYS
ncbi:uncharacterized protein LOC142358032 [Convolutriloba macropyga]|uniref:uncharacterized protein LOC142358032 n=1 Tax=Convolutriloba macropyga TaxID=536237 RepID=UPI003F5237D9